VQILDFSVVFYEFCKAETKPHEIIELLEGGLGLFALGPLERAFFSQMCPYPASTTAGRSAPVCSRRRRGRRQGGAGRAGPTGPRDCCGREHARQATVDGANDGEVRRPWRRVAVPGEGPANRRS
jgi:hypothetical protein